MADMEEIPSEEESPPPEASPLRAEGPADRQGSEAAPPPGFPDSSPHEAPYYKAELEQEIRELKRERDELMLRFTDQHPDVLFVDRQLERLEQQLRIAPEAPLREGVRGDESGDETIRPSRPRQAEPSPPIRARTLPDDWKPHILDPESDLFLADFSYAGYQWGERPIPSAPADEIVHVETFGAEASDGRDDTEAVLQALKRAHEKAGSVTVQFPPGRFIISDILRISRSGIRLRGSGDEEHRTRLFFPQPILELPRIPPEIQRQRLRMERENNRRGDELFSPASWTGGMIWIGHPMPPERPEPLAHAIRGSQGKHTLELEEQTNIRNGELIEVVWCTRRCDSVAFTDHVFDAQPVKLGDLTKRNIRNGLVRQYVTVEKVDGTRLIIKEPLLHDVLPQWGIALRRTAFLHSIALEQLHIEFPNRRYGGHLLEDGFNAVYVRDAAHSWVKDVVVENADSAFIVARSKNISLENVRTVGRGGHYATGVMNSTDVLVRDFDFKAPSVHGVSTGFGAERVVFTNGRIREMTIDQHHGANQQNLFDNLVFRLRDVSRLFDHGGSSRWGPAAAAFTVIWNTRVDFSKPGRPRLADGPSARIIGLHGSAPFEIDYGPNAWIEGLNTPVTTIPSLYEYQLKQRLDRKHLDRDD
ncbi:MAG: glycosyl hydrolase family 28-related protein [Gammaproteobacteria bacterium]|nr:glycosyl hydrolase family 28-related protein [Gammaproteobacteria bacterium]